MKKFYGGIFIEKEKLKEAGIENPIKLEYYKTIDDSKIRPENKYGIEIIKTQYIDDDTKVENKTMEHLSNNEETIDEILEILKNNEVTPICLQDIICDFTHEL